MPNGMFTGHFLWIQSSIQSLHESVRFLINIHQIDVGFPVKDVGSETTTPRRQPIWFGWCSCCCCCYLWGCFLLNILLLSRSCFLLLEEGGGLFFPFPPLFVELLVARCMVLYVHNQTIANS